MVAGKYLASKVYLVTKTSLGSSNQLELGVREGDVLGVIQQKDPLGNRARWFCDNGAAKGFVSADCLVQQPSEVEEKPVAVVAPYDEVTEDEYKKPTRKAPPVPRPGKSKSDQISLHSYEEIMMAGSEMADLSPLYEEIPGGSRSSLSSGSGSGRSSGRRSPRGKFYYAQYSFSPDLAEEAGTYMTVARGQVVRVIALSGDWWYVEDRGQARGYLPANYLRPYYPTQ